MPPELRTVLQAIFWCCIGTVAYSYAIYPILLYVLTKWRHTTPAPNTTSDTYPLVSVLVAAHNEERDIGKKIENTLASDYPSEQVEVVIASDGSSDRTAEIVRQFSSSRVRLFDYESRRGKSAVLNATIPELNSEIVVLSDANTLFEPDAISRLVRWFMDTKVDTVCGRLVLMDPATGQNVDSLYWRYETFLKKREARLDALLGANGAIYAIRLGRYVPIPDNTIVDDFVIPLLAKLHHGGRIVYDETAIAVEETPAAIGSEFRRRTRIGTGGYQSLALLWRLLHPRFGWTAFSLFSHKVLRWIAPFLLLGALSTNSFLLDEHLYLFTMIGQVLFYAASFVGVRVRGRAFPFKLLRLVGMFTSMNAALFVGFFRWLTMPQTGTWQRTSR